MKLRLLLSAVLLGTGLALCPAPALAEEPPSVYTRGHGDIRLFYTPGSQELTQYWAVDGGSTIDGAPLPAAAIYDPDRLIANVLQTTTYYLPAIREALDLSGSDVPLYVAGIAVDGEPNIGFSTEGVGAVDQWADGGYLSLRLAGFTGPGEMVIAQGPDILLSSINPGDYEIGIRANSHQHYNWYFTEAGYYEITFEWEGVHVADGVVTGSATFGVYTGPMPIPEPGTWALLLAGAAGAGVYRWRLQRRVIG